MQLLLGYMDFAKIIFCFSAFFLVYAYIGYPVTAWLISRFTSRKPRPHAPYLPAVSLLISAYNEESVIEEKILNSLSLDYPPNLLEISVISDGSTDRTDEIVNKYSAKGVALIRHHGRNGKTTCLNQAVPDARGDILVFSDANSLYHKDAVKNLVGRFHDSEVGFVTGYTRYRFKEGYSHSEGIGLYARIEKSTKLVESNFGCCVGADGAIFAIRKELFKPLQPADINDFVVPLSIIRQGFKGVLEEKAFCSENASVDVKSEFNRQVRITARTLRALFNNRDLLNPVKYPFFSFALFSHKLAKLLVPFFLLFLTISAVILLFRAGDSTILFLAGLSSVLLALVHHARKRVRLLSTLSSFAYSFTSINAAIFIGWLNFLKRKTFTTWAPTAR